MKRFVNILGLDIGSTTSRAIAVSGELVPRAKGGGFQLESVVTQYTSPVSLTPFEGASIDESAFQELLEEWKAGVAHLPLSTTGAIVTGLAARSPNIRGVEQRVRAAFDQATLVMAEDVRYESWLAFKGSCLSESVRAPGRTFFHLDIGGGTTNVAVGRAGVVEATGSYFIGARHLRFRSGTTELAWLSEFASRWLAELGISKGVGNTFSRGEIETVAGSLVLKLERIVRGSSGESVDIQASLPDSVARPDVLSFSGGIAPWIYEEPETPLGLIPYDDLGLALARGIRASPVLRKFPWAEPSELGLATVSGLVLFGAHFSGPSVHLGGDSILPLSEIPVVGTLPMDEGFSRWQSAIEVGLSGGRGAIAVFIDLPDSLLATVESAAIRLAEIRQSLDGHGDFVLVVLTERNVGKALGDRLTDWGNKMWRVIVVDQVPPPTGQLLFLGQQENGSIPVRYHGLV